MKTYYGQHEEDRTINALLGYPETRGFYIDVGAYHSEGDSVTKYFYDRGWQGVNIEPQAHYWEILCNDRPRDVNLQCAAGANRGQAYLSLNEGLSTLEPRYMDMTAPHVVIDVRTLGEICAAHAVPADVDFLKIDVEGYEKYVLLGMDWNYRPKVICIEAFAPMTTTPTYQEWEYLLLQQQYRCIFQDTANRYYV